MIVPGTSVAHSVAGVAQAERAVADAQAKARAKRPDPRAATRPADSADEVLIEQVENVEPTEALHREAGPEEEEAREQRQQSPPYTPEGRPGPEEPPHRIDVAG